MVLPINRLSTARQPHVNCSLCFSIRCKCDFMCWFFGREVQMPSLSRAAWFGLAFLARDCQGEIGLLCFGGLPFCPWHVDKFGHPAHVLHCFQRMTGSAFTVAQAGLKMFEKFCGIDLRTRRGHRPHPARPVRPAADGGAHPRRMRMLRSSVRSCGKKGSRPSPDFLQLLGPAARAWNISQTRIQVSMELAV